MDHAAGLITRDDLEAQWYRSDGVNVSASLLVEAQMNVVIDTSFGLTIVATLGLPP